MIKLSIGIWRAEHRHRGETTDDCTVSLEIVSWSRSAGEACGLVVAIASEMVHAAFFSPARRRRLSPLEFDTVSIVNDAVQYRVTESWIRDNVVPLGHRHLTCDQ